jgi:hypothetical protein
MKLRIKGNTLRLRVSRSEVARLIECGRIEETIQFAPQPEARLTYALEHSGAQQEVLVRYRAQEVAVLVPSETARLWAQSEQVGIYCNLRIGEGVLEIAVEKDFACLDGTDAENEDTFPNPQQGAVC